MRRCVARSLRAPLIGPPVVRPAAPLLPLSSLPCLPPWCRHSSSSSAPPPLTTPTGASGAADILADMLGGDGEEKDAVIDPPQPQPAVVARAEDVSLALSDRPPDVTPEEWEEFLRYVRAVEESDLAALGFAPLAEGPADTTTTTATSEGARGGSGGDDEEDTAQALRMGEGGAAATAGCHRPRSVLASPAIHRAPPPVTAMAASAPLLDGEDVELEDTVLQEAHEEFLHQQQEEEEAEEEELSRSRWADTPLIIPDKDGSVRRTVPPGIEMEERKEAAPELEGPAEGSMADGSSYLAEQDRAYLGLPPHPEAAIPPPSSTTERQCVLVVFAHNDLRVHDNYALALAVEAAGRRRVPVVAVCVLDYRTFAQPSAVGGFYRQSPQRAQWMLDNVGALRERLEGPGLGIPLLLRCGRPEEHVPRLAEDLGALEVWLTTQYSPHERRVHDTIVARLRAGEWVSRQPLLLPDSGEAEAEAEAEWAEVVPHASSRAQAPQVHSVWQTTLVHLDDLPTPVAAMREGERWYHDDVTVATIRPTAPYDAAIAAAADLPRWASLLPGPGELGGRAAPPLARGRLPTLEELGYGGVARYFTYEDVLATDSSHPAPGEAAAVEHVRDWLERGGLVSQLRLGRERRTNTKLYSPLLARVSPYLSLGVLSVRRLYEMLREHTHAHLGDGFVQMQYREALLRLSRRDYWHWMGLRYGARLFFSYGPYPELTGDLPDWRTDPKIVQRWCMGLTGIPFADAALRELRATGFVASEGRQALVWLLCRGYGQDWRLAAEWLERCSLDYDPFVCYGNCAYVCGLLQDDFGERVRTAHFLAHRHDQTGIYIKKWLPQLARVPPVYIHRPHVLTPRMQGIHHVFLGRNYPYPIKLWQGAQHTLGAAELTAYYPHGIRTGPGYGEAARHGRAVLPLEEWHLARQPQLLARRPWVTQFLPASAFEGFDEEEGEEGSPVHARRPQQQQAKAKAASAMEVQPLVSSSSST